MMGLARGAAGWTSDAKRMDFLLDSVFGPGVGANRGIGTGGLLGPALTCGFIVINRDLSPGLRTACSTPYPPQIHNILWDGKGLATKSSNAGKAKQETFLSFFSCGDSGSCEGFLLKN